jgi:putative Mg2+ transporter-C (MgtC) family protein
MKQGSSVTGLNTAATLWATTAVGALAGAAIIIAGNSLLHPLGGPYGRRQVARGRETPAADYLVEMECAAGDEARVRALLLDALTRPGLQLKSVRSVGATTTGAVAVRTELAAARRQDEVLENAVRDLTGDPAVRSVRWTTMHEAAVDWGAQLRRALP